MKKGSYSLIFELEEKQKIKIGALGQIEFKKGFYAYNGSAFGPGGLKRLERHKETMKEGNKLHWHIDYLLANEKISYIGYIASNEDIECFLSQTDDLDHIEEFGSSDCNCNSHLLYSSEKQKLIDILTVKHREKSQEINKEL